MKEEHNISNFTSTLRNGLIATSNNNKSVLRVDIALRRTPGNNRIPYDIRVSLKLRSLTTEHVTNRSHRVSHHFGKLGINDLKEGGR
ncbi:unnamed protein product [Linum trigynum]|uniref:Uncharacterized protein n=1 Tax=Linum trigynum TaxID=586398 RepID=A0AAV2FDH9_9ROSI